MQAFLQFGEPAEAGRDSKQQVFAVARRGREAAFQQGQDFRFRPLGLELQDMRPQCRGQLGRAAAVHEPPFAQEGHLIAVPGFFQVVRGQQHGRPLAPPQARQEAPDGAPVDDVQADRGFVQKQHPRLVQHAAGDIQGAAHAPRQRPDHGVAPLVELEQPQQFFRAPGGQGRRQSVQGAREHEVLPATEVAVQGGLLEYQADLRADPHRVAAHVAAGHPGLAGAGTRQGAQHVDGGRFAGTIRPQQSEELALGDIQVQRIHREEVAVALAQSPGKHGVPLRSGGGGSLRESRGRGGDHRFMVSEARRRRGRLRRPRARPTTPSAARGRRRRPRARGG